MTITSNPSRFGRDLSQQQTPTPAPRNPTSGTHIMSPNEPKLLSSSTDKVHYNNYEISEQIHDLVDDRPNLESLLDSVTDDEEEETTTETQKPEKVESAGFLATINDNFTEVSSTPSSQLLTQANAP